MFGDNVDWMKNAACKAEDTEHFYPDYHSSRIEFKAHVAAAKQLCSECTVRTQCLNYALEYEIIGIWGGMTEKERDKHRKAHNITVNSSAVQPFKK